MKYFTPILLFISCLSVQAQFDQKTLNLTRISEKIELDGKLNEPFWSSCDSAYNFFQQFPFDSIQARNQTVVKVAYDDKYIYIGAICYNIPNGKPIVSSLKRDFNTKTSDCFNIYMDTYNDKINGFTFGVTPYDSQSEGLLQFGGNFGNSTDWDHKWFSKTTIEANRWIAEIKIPFKTIRYKPKNRTWRINFMRSTPGDNEISVWNQVPFNFSSTSLAYTGLLQWPEDPPKPKFNFSLIPYAIGGFSMEKDEPIKWTYNFGGDAKVSITSALNLDLTFNPDFSQVDVDRQVTNITRFSLFFPERRQFFLENADLFSSFGFRNIRPFFSRRIGLINGQPVPIIAGARITGKLSQKIRIGAMNITTAASESLGIEAQNYSVATMQWQAFGRSSFGFIFVNRQGFNGSTISDSSYNRIVGIDYNLQSKDNKWLGKFFFHHSISPDNNDNALAHAAFFRYADTKWQVAYNHEYVGRNYNAEVGFVPRQFFYDQDRDTTVKHTYWRLEPDFSYNIFPKSKKLYRIKLGVYTSMYADSVFNPNDVVIRGYANLEFYNTSKLNFSYSERYTNLLYPIDVTGSTLDPLPTGPYHYRDFTITYTSNSRSRFTYAGEVTFGSYFNGLKLTYAAFLNYRIQPWGNIGVRFSRNEIWLDEPYGESHLMLISPKLEFTFRKNIFWTTFVQINSQINNMNIYSRFQWRFLPMSDVFLVYSENIALDPLQEKNRGVQLKVVYWFNP